MTTLAPITISSILKSKFIFSSTEKPTAKIASGQSLYACNELFTWFFIVKSNFTSVKTNRNVRTLINLSGSLLKATVRIVKTKKNTLKLKKNTLKPIEKALSAYRCNSRCAKMGRCGSGDPGSE